MINLKPIGYFLLLIIVLSCYSGVAINTTDPTTQETIEQDSIPLQNPFIVIRKHLNDNNYLKPLLHLKRKEQEYLDSNFKVPYLESLILLSSYLNDYQEAFKYEALLLKHFDAKNNLREKNSIELTSAPIDSLEMVNSTDKIIEIAKHKQVIMFNEEHRQPQHRAFLLELLPTLYESGFRYLAAETLTAKDSLLNQRGYATQSTGFYTSDPVYGNIIRLAHDLGFTLVPYEYEGEYPEESSPDDQQELREKGQAQNLIDNIFKKHPSAKVVVFAGRSHIAEASFPTFSFMAWHFKNLSGIDPFTIDQVQLSERYLPEDEVPLYKYILKTKNPTQAVSFINSDGALWAGTEIYDLRVLHPKTIYIKGRPSWLFKSNIRTSHNIKTKKLDLKIKNHRYTGMKPLIIHASKVGDAPNGIPIDLVILDPGDVVPVLLLTGGIFKIEAKDEEGKILGSYLEQI